SVSHLLPLRTISSLEDTTMTLPNLSGSIASALLRAEGYGVNAPGQITPNQPDPSSGRPAFTITISREVGALGNTVAHELGGRLGWPVYDQEILNKMAEQMGKPREHLHALDERHVHWLGGCPANLVTPDHPGPPHSPTKNPIWPLPGAGPPGNSGGMWRGGD